MYHISSFVFPNSHIVHCLAYLFAIACLLITTGIESSIQSFPMNESNNLNSDDESDFLSSPATFGMLGRHYHSCLFNASIGNKDDHLEEPRLVVPQPTNQFHVCSMLWWHTWLPKPIHEVGWTHCLILPGSDSIERAADPDM